MALREGDKTVTFNDVSVMKETDAALLVVIDDLEHWIPKSQISDDSEVFDANENSSGALIVSEWIVKQKGLI